MDIIHTLLLILSVTPSLIIIEPLFVNANIENLDNKSVLCLDAEREALLAFRKALTDPSGRLSSWSTKDCCKWDGIRCNNQTGHVAELDLRNPYQLINGRVGDPAAYKRSCLGGTINPSLLQLGYLNYLDLSMNDFEGIPIPDFFGQLKYLKYLNLSFASFSGEIPLQLGNLSSLQYLDLHADSYSDTGYMRELHIDTLDWLSGFSSLKHLDLGFVKLNQVGSNWLNSINMLRSLVELRLYWCELQGISLSMPFINFTSLSVLDLSENSFNSEIPQWLFNLTSLTKLYLRWDFFSGPIPNEFSKLKSLEVLDLSNNLELNGKIPGLFGSLYKLKSLDLSANNLNGEIHEFLGNFSSKSNNLVFLHLSSNLLTGEISESLGNLKNLAFLGLSGNSFWGSIPSSLGNLTSLEKLDLSYNKMNGTIPESFGHLSNLVDANLIENSWEGILHGSHLMNLKRLESFRLTTEPTRNLVFNVSYKSVPNFRLKTIQLENCLVGPFFPAWLQVQSELTSVILKNVGISDAISEEWFSKISYRVTYLILSNNQIKGTLPQKLEFPNLQVVDLSSNRFQGPLPKWSSNATDLFFHDNEFSGPLPKDLGVLMPRLQKVHLSHNRLDGEIPSSICDLGLQILSLRSNKLSGEIPDCWYHSQMLWAIDISGNSLTGKIPSSFGNLRSLSVLMLSDNNLDGQIPSSLQNCSGLTSIDLGGNKLSGDLPSWIENNMFSSLFMMRLQSNSFTGKIPENLCNLKNLHILDLSHNKFTGAVPKCIGKLSALAYGNSSEVFERLIKVAMKGREPEYSKIVTRGNSIDFSWNNLTGEIPDEVSQLLALHMLNLSHNHLSGRIPQSLSLLKSLGELDLSYNNLEGRIPSFPKFKDPSVYEGNPLLCGPPLPTKCPKN